MDNRNIYDNYGANSIEVSDNVEKHRRNPAQYLSSSNVNGIINQLIEFMFNAFDENVEYHTMVTNMIENKYPGQDIKVRPFVTDIVIHEGDSVTVRDMGRGMPSDVHPDTKEPAVFSIFENDSAGAKGNFSDSVYLSKGTSGMHGAGAAVSKSCTEIMDVEVREGRSNHKYRLRYIKGYREKTFGDNGLYVEGELEPHPYEELANLGFSDTGTSINYKYDKTVLEPVRDGVTVEPYREEDIVSIIRMYLLGLDESEKDRIIVRFTFKGEETIISPYDLTPEKYLESEGDIRNLLKIPVERMSDLQGDKANFSGTVYINFSTNRHNFGIKTIVNRLEQRMTKHDSKLEDSINKAFRTILREWIKQNPKKEYVMPHGASFRPADNFNTMIIMNLPEAEFGGQTKDRLESDAYVGFLGYQIENYLINNIDKIIEPLEYFQEHIKEHTKFIKQRKKEEDRKKKREEKSRLRESEDEYIQNMKTDALARLNEEEKGGFVLDIKRPQNINYESCVVCFFEGDTANTVVNNALNRGEQIVSVVTKGKLPNIQRNPGKITDTRIRQLRYDIMSKNYARYIIFVDPDADGNHIRIQLLKIIEEYRPDMLEQGRVSICRAPYGRVMNGTGNPIELETGVEGKRFLPTGESFVLSYEEMEQAVKKGAIRLTSYKGALDVVNRCQDILPFETMIKDPLYLVKVQPPTTRDINSLNDVLDVKSEGRSRVTKSMYTDRQRYSKYIARQATGNKLGIKVKDMSRPTVCRVTTTPDLSDVYKFSLPNFGNKSGRS